MRVPKRLSTYFDSELDFRVQAFNLLAFGGFSAGTITALTSLFFGSGLANTLANLATAVASILCLYFVRRTGAYRVGFLTAVILIFVITFPYLFFIAGGYRGSMPCFFIFAIVFTALMLEGRDRKQWLTVEFLVYASCIMVAYFKPEIITPFETEFDVAMDVLVGIVVVGTILLTVVHLYIRIYNAQRTKDEARIRELLIKIDNLETASESTAEPTATYADYGLTARESDVATLLISGKQRKEIAGILYISQGTVNTHCLNIYRKTDCSSPLDLMHLFGAQNIRMDIR
ncbi:MAG: helix-turn-helix transcriptional regulator [Propionibacteriaceae bacterium]|jgi:DNA-binding CsgD family transcriptional regulator|nr:helix-turn-helix transcriptional regulator [Propionibacteriaceae bacterium]